MVERKRKLKRRIAELEWINERKGTKGKVT